MTTRPPWNAAVVAATGPRGSTPKTSPFVVCRRGKRPSLTTSSCRTGPARRTTSLLKRSAILTAWHIATNLRSCAADALDHGGKSISTRRRRRHGVRLLLRELGLERRDLHAQDVGLLELHDAVGFSEGAGIGITGEAGLDRRRRRSAFDGAGVSSFFFLMIARASFMRRCVATRRSWRRPPSPSRCGWLYLRAMLTTFSRKAVLVAFGGFVQLTRPSTLKAFNMAPTSFLRPGPRT